MPPRHDSYIVETLENSHAYLYIVYLLDRKLYHPRRKCLTQIDRHRHCNHQTELDLEQRLNVNLERGTRSTEFEVGKHRRVENTKRTKDHIGLAFAWERRLEVLGEIVQCRGGLWCGL